MEQNHNNQYLIFNLDDDLMGLPINLVREVIDLDNLQIAKMPGAKDYFLGVINLRGQVIPLIDLKQKIGKASQIKDKAIIIEYEQEYFGVVIDFVHEVSTVEEQSTDFSFTENPLNLEKRKIGRILGKEENGKEKFVFLLTKDFLFEKDEEDSVLHRRIS